VTYSELCAAVSSYCENTFPTADMNVFITEAEKRIYNTVQISALRKNVTGAMTASNKYLACPDDFLATYSLAIIDPVTGAYSYLLNKDVNFIRECYTVPTTTGTPKYYALFGSRLTQPTELSFMVGPTPDVGYAAELHYFYYPESITTAASGTTWLGDNFDPVLLYGAIIEAYTYLKGEADLLQLYVAKYTEAMQQLKRLGDGLERGDAYRDGQAKVKVP